MMTGTQISKCAAFVVVFAAAACGNTSQPTSADQEPSAGSTSASAGVGTVSSAGSGSGGASALATGGAGATSSAGAPAANGGVGGAGANGGASANGGAPAAGGTSANGGAGGSNQSNGGASGHTASGGSAGSGGSSGASAGAGGNAGASGHYTCNLLLGVSATGEWFPDFVSLIGGSRWEAITREHEYVEFWAQLDPDRVSPGSAVRSDIWAQVPAPACAAGANAPDRVVFVAFAETSNATYNNYANVADTTVRANWVTALEKVVSITQSKYPSVKRIELMTMIRGPGTSGPGQDCDTSAATSHEDIVEPWVDDAMATVAAAHPALVAVAPKFYVDSCSWFNATGPHFVPAGHPELVAQKVAAYYSAHP